MLNLYELKAEIESVLLIIEAMEDENSIILPDEELFVRLHALKMERALLISNMGRAFKAYRGEADAISNEKRTLAAKQSAAEARMERVQRFLLEILSPDEKYKDAALSIGWRKKPDRLVIPEDLSLIPAKFLRIEPRLQDIRDLLKQESVPWARLTPNEEKSLIVK